MITMVIISLIVIMTDSTSKLAYLHRVIWFIFLIDVSIRFYRTARKWNYVKGNPFDIISVIPLEDMFLLARFSRLLRLFRYKNAIKRYLDRLDTLVNRMKFIRVTFSVIITHIVIMGGLVLLTKYTVVESFIWVELNFFKFNYMSESGDFIILAIIVKIAGILYMGVVLNKILNYGKERYDDWKFIKDKKKDQEHVDTVNKEIDNYDNK